MAFLGLPPRKEGPAAIPTYRHILSPQSMTVFNPLRVIAHCDIDAAYAQFEQVRLGLADDLPLICAQWQSIIAVNYPARKFGIKRFNTIDEARKLCPHLIVQHVATYRNGEEEAGYWGEVDPKTHKVSLDPYRRESLKILAIFKEMVPKGEIEKASIDEAFLDLTPMVIDRLIAKFPYLGTVPPDAPDMLDSSLPPAPPIDWTAAGNVFPIGGDKEEQPASSDAPEGEQGQSASVKAEGASWEDWALCLGAEIMAELRAEVWKRLHYTCSAGIAHNKAMSKLSSSWKKPNNQTILRSAAVPAFLRDMDFTDIRFLGGKLGNAIATEYNAKTVGDMLTVPLEELQSRFGEESIWVYNILRGIDHTEVTPRVATKSMLASKNTRPPVTTIEQGLHWINVLAGELNVRLRESREIAPGLWPKTLVLGHRTGAEASKSRQIPFPFTRHLSTEYIVKYAKKLWEEVCQPMKHGATIKYNNMSLSFTGLERLEEGQQGIEGFFSAPKPSAIGETKSAGVLGKRSRSSSPKPSPDTSNPGANGHSTAGAQAKTRLPTLHTGKRKTGLDNFFAKNGESSSSAKSASAPSTSRSPVPPEVIDISDEPIPASRLVAPVVPNAGKGEEQGQSEMEKWQCPQCNTLFSAPDALGRGMDDQKREHDDYHFALTLQDGPGEQEYGTGRMFGNRQPAHEQRWEQAPSTKDERSRKKPKAKKDGIKAFFAPKPPDKA